MQNYDWLGNTMNTKSIVWIELNWIELSGHYEINKPESREAEQVVDDSNDAGRVEGLHDDQKF